MASLPLQSNYFSSERLKLWGVEDLNMFFDTRKFYMKSTLTISRDREIRVLNSRVSSFQLKGVLDVCFVVVLKDHLLLVTGDLDPKSNLQYLWNLFLSFSPPLPFV